MAGEIAVMSLNWLPVFVLPNIELNVPVDCEMVTLAPADDPRVKKLKQAHPTFQRFLGRFSDNFGVKFEPATLLVREDGPAAFREVSAIASFRDAISVSVTTFNRTLELRYPRGHRVLFGEAFAIYPWMIDKHYENVIGNTMAILGLHDIDKLRGQSSPAITRMRLGSSDFDEPLLTELLVRWCRRYEADTTDWSDIALFRSLNMAHQATLLPASSDGTFYDVGRLISLWVSALEILVHPGGNGHANRDKVCKLLEQTKWELCSTANPVHLFGKSTNLVLASRLCHALYKSRNDFLHTRIDQQGRPLNTPHAASRLLTLRAVKRNAGIDCRAA